MKYATFKDFVRDAFYHGVDMMELDIDFKVDESGHTLAEPNIWRTTLHRQINTKDFDAAEIWLHAACNSITIPGVCSWLPDKAAMDEAYEAKIPEAVADMLMFKANSSYDTSCGLVFSVLNPTECSDFSHIVNHKVQINGEVYLVLGVERFAHTPPHKVGEPIGLLVKMPTKRIESQASLKKQTGEAKDGQVADCRL